MRAQLFVMCLSVIAALGSVSSTAAATASGSGTGLITGVGFSVANYQPVNGGAVLTADVEDLYSGALTGDAPGTYWQATNARTGAAVFLGVETCACTVAGQTGTVTVVFRGRLYADGNTTGTVELKDGRGGLAGLHGRGTFQGNFLLPLPYTLQYSFGS